MFYILHGDEEFLRSEEVARLKAEILSDGMGDLNITTLDGRRVDRVLVVKHHSKPTEK